MQGLFYLPDGAGLIMNNGGNKGSIGLALCEHLVDMVNAPSAPGGDDGDIHVFRNKRG